LPARNASSSRPSRSRTPSGTRPARQRGLSGGSSGSAPALASSADGVRACRGRDQHRCDTAPVPMPPVATNGMATRARTNCSSDKSPKERNAVRGSLLLACSRARRQAGSLLIRTYKSDWQISGKRRLPALGHAPGRVLDPPGLLVYGGAPPPESNRATPFLPFVLSPTYRRVAAGQKDGGDRG